jgi:hypothetical protein
MSNFSFTKLFSSITESTIWAEPDHVRILWITMLAMCDRQGRVYATIPGLAGRARISVEQCEEALGKFTSPDKYSRSKEFEGRRVEEIDGGWLLLNYERYRELRDSEADKEKKRRWAAKHRAYEKRRLAASTVDHDRPGVEHGRPKTEDRGQKTEAESPVGETAAPPPVTFPAGLGKWAVATWAAMWKEVHGASPDISQSDAGSLHTLAKRMIRAKGMDVDAGKALFVEYAGWFLSRNGFWAEKAHPIHGLVSAPVANEFKAGA